MRFDKSFTGQFLIAPNVTPRAGAQLITMPSTNLEVFDGIRQVPVVDNDGRRIGILLGVVVDLNEQVIVSLPVALSITAAADTAWDIVIENEIYKFAGSFVFLLDDGITRRIYLDANGTLSLVYDVERQQAATTTGLILSDTEYEERFRADLHAAFDVNRDGWFTGGLTAHTGIRRLLSNHYLDLTTWRAVRHWPIGPIAQAADPSDAIAEINRVVRRTTHALLATGPVSVALTAGNETRALLACYRHILSDLTFVTLDAPGYDLDLVRAKELASLFQLQHNVLPYVRASQDQIEAWQYRAGHCITGNNMPGHPSIAPLAGQFFVGGLGGEVGRGFLWLNAEKTTSITAESLLVRLKLPHHPLILAEIEAWLSALPNYDGLFVLDLAYIELRMSCWAFAQSYATPTVLTLYPLISRRSYEAMMALPPEIRRNNGMIRLCIEQSWPDVMALPINKYGDLRDYTFLLRKAMRNPRRAWKKVLQVLKSRRTPIQNPPYQS